MRASRTTRWLAAAPMAALAVATVYPLVFTTNVALKTRHDYILDRFSPTRTAHWDNLGEAWASAGVSQYFVNSLIVVGCAVVLLLALGSMAGFALSHLPFRGSRALFLACLAALFIPFQVIMVPLARTMTGIGLIDTYPGLILAYVAQFLPFTIYLMTSYYSGIPADIVDAARIDGSSVYGVYRRIMLPLGAPALLSVGVLDALFCWNDVLIALLLMPSAQHRTLMVGITSLRGQYSDDIPTFAAGVLIAAVPILVVYLVFQRQIADAVTAGATKG
ncbi:multiple sugar transport system permease protein [Hamadaea flava]|uniref:Carbohydrate ABC transporter permease n=1 Tax=Hamadaea flava TaxID=1742688 RepID=A0ABV8LS52_9ACTN|nr:carbohydrate ABC transporter permease [Hamadaea flava]MCP2328738.1 multiple sugar transport system permease protein [Hamadaea flava]